MEAKLVTTDEILVEINAVIGHAVEKEGRDELTAEEMKFIAGLCNRMVKETKMQLSQIGHLMPEEIPVEEINEILKQNGGALDE